MIAKLASYLTKGSSQTYPEGGHWLPERGVIIEFPSMEALSAWYTDPACQPLTAPRKRAAI
ncbi:DUF1330 domain-containing protein [Bradyrhizobium lablabi]|uniref:DUF1330 domain-containing protein n=1 Tax=Bradyrhizobium lablabi TaxID=722472 RepID=UPI001BA8F793|nr:DUF1330 domain-containing protein [Bradyrhizobium lablabi]